MSEHSSSALFEAEGAPTLYTDKPLLKDTNVPPGVYASFGMRAGASLESGQHPGAPLLTIAVFFLSLFVSETSE